MSQQQEPANDGMTRAATTLIEELNHAFEPERAELLGVRNRLSRALVAGDLPDFPSSTQFVRENLAWSVAPPPAELSRRTVELLPPAGGSLGLDEVRSSGADAVVIVVEESVGCLPVLEVPSGETSGGVVTFLRPRGLAENGRLPDDDSETVAVSASVVDAAAYIQRQSQGGDSGKNLFLDLPGVEHYLEARWWNALLNRVESELDLTPNTVRARVAIETVSAAFQMDEILWELRDRSLGLVAAPAEYLTSTIRAFPTRVVPDRIAISMRAPFVHAYMSRLVDTCHKRAAHAIGPPLPFLLADGEAADHSCARAGIDEDADFVAQLGFDGAQVTDPTSVTTVRERLDSMLGGRPHQMTARIPEGIPMEREDLMDIAVPGAEVTRDGVRANIRICLAALVGQARPGSASRDGLAATASIAELCRVQLQQWLSEMVSLDGDSSMPFTLDAFDAMVGAEIAAAGDLGTDLADARRILVSLVGAH